MRDVYVVVPDGIDDPARPSGGNTYDRRACRGLAASGWSVHERAVAGGWPQPDAAALGELAALVASIPDGAVVVMDGLVASTAPEVLAPAAARLRLVVLTHLPLGDDPLGDGAPGAGLAAARAREGAVLSAASAVITTSTWTRGRLLNRYPLQPGRVHVAEPGVDPAPLAALTPGGVRLLCVAAVTRPKGHDVLLAALARLKDLAWQCLCVGSLDIAPGFANTTRRLAAAGGLTDRVRFTGPQTGDRLSSAYADADLLVLASRSETYGMVVTEALARGLPVVASAVGGLPEALGQASGGGRPGLLVPPDDPAALAAALRRWLLESDLRHRLRRAARERRASLTRWSATSAHLSDVLADVAT